MYFAPIITELYVNIDDWYKTVCHHFSGALAVA